MRYKCVIPMVVDQEAKELKKQREKEDEEKHVTEKANNDGISKVEINESKDRVHEHFKQMSQTMTQDLHPSPKKMNKKKKKLKNAGISLGLMHDRKRKRESNVTNAHENPNKSFKTEFSTPTPSLDTRITHMSKRAKQDARETIEEYKVQQNLAQVRYDSNAETKSIR